MSPSVLPAESGKRARAVASTALLHGVLRVRLRNTTKILHGFVKVRARRCKTRITQHDLSLRNLRCRMSSTPPLNPTITKLECKAFFKKQTVEFIGDITLRAASENAMQPLTKIQNSVPAQSLQELFRCRTLARGVFVPNRFDSGNSLQLANCSDQLPKPRL